MMPDTRLGVLGGTFDPVHAGHLAAARAAAEALDLTTVVFVLSLHPPHRAENLRVSAYHRFAMIALALAGEPRFTVSDVELRSDRPSYTSTTLARFAALGLRPEQIFFITGADAFAEIPTWHDYPALLDRAHFVVVSRPGYHVRELGERLPALAPRMIAPDARAGAVAGPAIFLVPAATPDVSSTEIRRRIAAGEPLADLVPEAVARYIMRQRLYAETTVDATR
jgi:nicotinate-nucleotide adenylyltransferase